MKFVLIKAGEMPRIVELGKKHNYTDLKRLLDIDSPIDCVERKIGSHYYDLWVDDEGLFKDPKFVVGFLDAPMTNENLCGSILIACHDEDGNTIGLTEEQLAEVLDESNYIEAKPFRFFDGDFGIWSYEYAGFGRIYCKKGGRILRYGI